MSWVAVRARTTLPGWCAGGLLLAVAAAIDPAGFRPFTTARWVIVGVLAAAGAAATTRWRLPRWAAIAWLGLLAALALATATGLDPLQSLLGHGRRHLGVAGWLVGACAFLLGHALTGGALRVLGRWAAVAGAVTGLAACVDLLGWEPLGTTFAGGRVGGLLGQPTYLAAFAVLLGPVAAGVALSPDESPAWRRLAAVAAAGCGVAVLASETRGAWLALAVAVAVAWLAAPAEQRARLGEGVRSRLPSRSPTPVQPLVFSLQDGQRRRRGRAMSACALGVLALVVVAGPVGQRSVDTFDSSQGGGSGRLDEWRLAARVIADDPLTGTGPEGYRIAAAHHVGDSYARRHGRDEVIDRAHNGILDVAASAGLPAAGFYAVLLGGVVLACVRILRRGAGVGVDPVLAGAAVGVVAWIVQQAVSFPIAEVDPAGWLLAGVVVSAAGVVTAGSGRGWAVGGTRLAAGALAVALAGGGLLAVVGDRGLRRAERLRTVSVAAAMDAADQATALRPDDIDAWYVAARVAATRPGILGVDAALERVEEGLSWSPDDPALRALNEELLVERALRSGREDDLAAARSATEALMADDPSGPAHHRYAGLVLAAQGQEEQAKSHLRRALELDADDSAARRALDALGE